jgi:hypothetical protein
MDTKSTPLVKGTVVINFLKFINSELNEKERGQLFSTVREEYRYRIANNKILATDQLPVSILNDLTMVAANIKGEAIGSFARRVGRFASEEGVKGIYQLFGRELTPAYQLAKASLFWSMLYDKGRMEAVEKDKNGAIIRLIDYPSEVVMCERIYGWLERMNQLTGVKNTKVIHSKCYTRGNEYCEWEVSWD